MLSKKFNALVLAAIPMLGVQLAEAQSPLGVRASGMAGAFVAVANDASAVYWNPAGLATGAYASFVVDFGKAESLPSASGSPVAAWRQTGQIVALSLPPVGLAYYRQGAYATGPREPAVSSVPDREEVRRSVHALTTSTIGATLLHSLGEYLVVGTTLKLVRGQASTGLRGDLDAGLMVSVNRLRLGLVARNVTAPSFTLAAAAGQRVELARQVRAGGAWGSNWPGTSRLVVAVDADLTARAVPSGDRRDVAAGVETWWKAQRLGVRAGVRRSMIGGPRSVVAAGVSAGLTASIFLEAHVARGQQEERSWNVGVRFGF